MKCWFEQSKLISEYIYCMLLWYLILFDVYYLIFATCFPNLPFSMGQRVDDVMRLCCELSANQQVQTTVKGSSKGAATAGGLAFAGGLVGGPLGIAVGQWTQKMFIIILYSCKFLVVIVNKADSVCGVFLQVELSEAFWAVGLPVGHSSRCLKSSWSSLLSSDRSFTTISWSSWETSIGQKWLNWLLLWWATLPWSSR